MNYEEESLSEAHSSSEEKIGHCSIPKYILKHILVPTN